MKSPLELAALATVAVPGMQVIELRAPQYDDEYASVTGVVDSNGHSWIVMASKEETTAEDIGQLSRTISYLRLRQGDGDIPFEVPQLHGAASTSPTTYAYVFSLTGGHALHEDQLQGDGLLAASLGRALALLHNLDPVPVAGLGVRAVSVEDARLDLRRTLASIGREVPAGLRKRWNIALDEDCLWTFDAAPVHGDLDLKNVLADDGAVISITGFRYFRMDDPAIDLAWILPLADESFIARLLQAYSSVRSVPDLHLLTRAQLYSELALLQWLQYGQESGDSQIVAEAVQMLSSLDTDLGGALLISPSKPVAEIRFTVDDEPLYRLQRQDSEAGAEVDAATDSYEAGAEPFEDGPAPDDLDLTPTAAMMGRALFEPQMPEDSAPGEPESDDQDTVDAAEVEALSADTEALWAPEVSDEGETDQAG